MESPLPGDKVYPGRYAAIDVGTNSVLLLVADVDRDGGLLPLCEEARITRLGEGFAATGLLAPPAISRTLKVVAEYITQARRFGAERMAVVGTEALRAATNGGEFCERVRAKCGVPVEVITGDQEAELAWRAQSLGGTIAFSEARRIVLDIGGGSTEVVQGVGDEILNRVSFKLGAVRVTEGHLKSDPPTPEECGAAESAIEQVLSPIEPMRAGATLIGTGGTITNLAAVARASGMISAPETHGAVLPHTRVAELVDLFRSLPVRFRQRIPSLEPERADVILGGAMILHQAMARLAATEIRASTNGIRHGCVLLLARRTLEVIQP